MTETVTGWTPELFAEFWAAPDPAPLPAMVTDDVVGHWPGGHVVRGSRDYIAVLERLMRLLPDLRLEVAAGAMNGEHGFVRWIMHATGEHGPFQLDGADCITVRDGLVRENHINFDSALFRTLSGHDVPV
jgi:hypothetical protein